MNPRTDIVEVAALLVAARTVVADPARWYAWPHALDPYCVKWDGRASPVVRWGALGALDRAAADAHAARGSIAKATALLDRAKTLSPEGITLYTHQRNENARAFYERRGFEAVEYGVSPPPESEPDVKYRWRPPRSTR